MVYGQVDEEFIIKEALSIDSYSTIWNVEILVDIFLRVEVNCNYLYDY